jgi:hypothetical protein
MLLMLVRYRLAVTVAPRQDHDGASGTSLSSYDWQSAIGWIETDLLVQQPLGANTGRSLRSQSWNLGQLTQ